MRCLLWAPFSGGVLVDVSNQLAGGSPGVLVLTGHHDHSQSQVTPMVSVNVELEREASCLALYLLVWRPDGLGRR